MADHVHMLVMIPSKYSVSAVMGYLKGKSFLMIFDRYAQLKYKYGNRRFWSVGYYISTVGLNEAAIRKYIREQDQRDMMLDKMTSKEYTDPSDRSRESSFRSRLRVKRHGGLNLRYRKGADLVSSSRRLKARVSTRPL